MERTVASGRAGDAVVLVTGASGFVGSHLVELLVAAGRRVRALVRDPGTAAWLRGLPIEVVAGDLGDRVALRRAVADAAVVYHVAAATRAPREAELHRVNAGGTLALLEAALEGAPRLRRFVLVSSLAAAGPGPGSETLTEEAPERPVSAYGRSKLAAERVCRERAGGLPVTVVRPPAVYGPRDRDFLTLFRAAARGVSPLVGFRPKHLSLVHVADLVAGIALAGEHPRAAGRTYYLAATEVHEQAEIGELAGRAIGRRPVRLRIPEPALAAVAALAHGASLLGARTGLVNLDKAREAFQDNWTCSPARAAEELGFAARIRLAEGFAETAAWYRSHGWL